MSNVDTPSAALPQKSAIPSLLGKGAIIMAGLAIGAVIGLIVALEMNWIPFVC